MAEQKKAPKHVADENVDVMELEPVKQIEIETKNLVASSRVFIYTIIGLLAYMIFMVIPSIEEKVTWINASAEWIRWHIRPWIDDAKRIKGYTISFYSIDLEKQSQFKRSLEDDSTQAILSSLVIPVLSLIHI